MSKSFNVDINTFNNNNDMDNIYAGGTPNADIKPIKPRETHDNKQKRAIIDHKKTNGTNKKDNYAITFKIDEDITDYLKNILWINRKTKNQYVNDLIRADMIKRLNLKSNATYDEIQTAWENYKKANNI